MPEGDVFKLRIIWSNADTDEEVSSGLHGVQEGLIAPSISAMGDDVKAWWNTDLGSGFAQKAMYSPDIALKRVELRRVEPLEPLILSYTTGLPIAGTGTGDSLAPGTAVVVSLRTASVGRHYRGRAYLPPPAEQDVGPGGDLGVATATVFKEQYEALIASLATDAFVPIVWATVEDDVPLDPTIKTDITDVLVDRRLRSQRRRSVRTPLYA